MPFHCIFTISERNNLVDLLNNYDFKELKLLYSTIKNEFDIKLCHSLCQNYKNIVWLIHTTNNNIFGAFTTTKWNTNNGIDVKDPYSFIFLLRSKDKLKKLTSFDIIQPQNMGVWYHSNYFCLIGTGYDISIYKKCTKKNQYTYCSKGNYKTPTKYYLNNNKKSFIVKNMEIYHCI